MRNHRVFVFIVLSFLILITINVSAETRTALVIGNGAYKSSPLTNPVNDAGDIANVLIESGFKVTLKLNATQREMESAVKEFGKELRNGGVGLFYYAGHGVQVGGRNYLIPVDADIESESDIKYDAVDAGRVLGKMEDAGNELNIIILDACRNNPFARSFRSVERGLARMDAPKGSLIAYATAPGSVAADGDGRNGVYTKYLIENIKKSGLTIEQVLKNVRVAVVSDTASSQVPWESSSLMGKFYFHSQQPEQNNTKPTVTETQPSDNSYELLFWESIKDSKDDKMFEAYLEQFPNGKFSKLAEINIQKNRINPILEQQAPVIIKDIQKESVKVSSIDPADKNAGIVSRDRQYVKYENGIVYDKKTGLEWFAGPDKATHWDKAKAWVTNLELDGGGWRMPSKSELKTLYQKGIGLRNMTPLLTTTGWYVWTGEIFRHSVDLSWPYYYYFTDGGDAYDDVNGSTKFRAFAVRSRK